MFHYETKYIHTNRRIVWIGLVRVSTLVSAYLFGSEEMIWIGTQMIVLQATTCRSFGSLREISPNWLNLERARTKLAACVTGRGRVAGNMIVGTIKLLPDKRSEQIEQTFIASQFISRWFKNGKIIHFGSIRGSELDWQKSLVCSRHSKVTRGAQISLERRLELQLNCVFSSLIWESGNTF